MTSTTSVAHFPLLLPNPFPHHSFPLDHNPSQEKSGVVGKKAESQLSSQIRELVVDLSDTIYKWQGEAPSIALVWHALSIDPGGFSFWPSLNWERSHELHVVESFTSRFDNQLN